MLITVDRQPPLPLRMKKEVAVCPLRCTATSFSTSCEERGGCLSILMYSHLFLRGNPWRGGCHLSTSCHLFSVHQNGQTATSFFTRSGEVAAAILFLLPQPPLHGFPLDTPWAVCHRYQVSPWCAQVETWKKVAVATSIDSSHLFWRGGTKW
jgi:hypothetical protein